MRLIGIKAKQGLKLWRKNKMEEKKVFGCPEKGITVKCNICWECYKKVKERAIARGDYDPTNIEEENQYFGW
jgi:hypothetical protein